MDNKKKQDMPSSTPPLGGEMEGGCSLEGGGCFKIGRIGKPHGVKGEVSFHFSDDVFDRVEAEYLVLEIDGLPVPFFMEEYRFRSEETAIVKFCDVDSQEKAAQLTGCTVLFPRHLADDDDEMSLVSLVGYTLYDGEKAVGIISDIDDTTINTLFCLDNGALVPATEDWIVEIDQEKRTIIMSLPEGLI